MPTQTFDSFLLDERIAFLCRHRLISIIGHTAIACMTAVFLWSRAPHNTVILWFIFMMSTAFIAYCCLTPRVVGSRGFDGDCWMQRAMMSALLLGFSWGVVPLLFFIPNDPTFLIIVCCIYTGYISAAIPTTFSYAPVFYSFALGITAPFWWLLLITSGYEYEFMRLAIIVYVSILVLATHNIHTLFKNSSRSNFERLQLVEDLKLEREIAERATKSKDQFFAAASHDLRQPLNTISLFVEALQNRLENHQDLDTLAKIKRSLRGLNGMLHSLLDISKLDASAVVNEPKDVSLSSLVAQLIDEYQAKARHLELVNNTYTDAIVFADPTLLYRVVRNVLDNAVKFTQRGRIELYSELQNDHTKLIIRDTGVGISKADITSVFEEFKQLHNPERNREKGLGLGLSIVKRLSDLADFEISIESKLGKGTTVSLCIPNGTLNDNPTYETKAHAGFSGKHILVVDDELDILEGMSSMLDGWGCTITAAESLEQANDLLIAKDSKPDLIISDLRLNAGKLGTDAIDSVRDEFNETIPAILITGDTAPKRISLARDTGLDVLYKPIDTGELKAIVTRIFA